MYPSGAHCSSPVPVHLLPPLCGGHCDIALADLPSEKQGEAGGGREGADEPCKRSRQGEREERVISEECRGEEGGGGGEGRRGESTQRATGEEMGVAHQGEPSVQGGRVCVETGEQSRSLRTTGPATPATIKQDTAD